MRGAHYTDQRASRRSSGSRILDDVSAEPDAGTCDCPQRPVWSRLEDDRVLRWPVVEIAEWEELRQCPTCGSHWLSTWPEELDGSPILCRPQPPDARRLRDIDRAATLRAYCLASIEEHLGELKEEKRACKKVDCERKRLRGTPYCIEHLIAQRFGRQLAKLDRKEAKAGSRAQSVGKESEMSIEEIERLLAEAIAARRTVSFELDGCARLGEPHDLGIIHAQRRLFFYQLGGASRSGRPLGWRWASLEKLSRLKLREETFSGERPAPSGRHHEWETLVASVSRVCTHS
jgi:hypothetical protein